MAMNRPFDIEAACRKLDIPVDMSRLAIRLIDYRPWPFFNFAFLRLRHEKRQLSKIAREADACISTSGIVDFGKPAHRFLCQLTQLGGMAFYDHVQHIKARTGIRRLYRRFCTWMNENIIKRVFGIHSTKRLLADSNGHVYPPSGYFEKVMRGFYGPFNSTVFYPPTIFEFSEKDVPRNPLLGVYIGRIFPQKRIEAIIAIVEQARKLSGKDLQLQIAGELMESPYSNLLKKLASERPWLKLVGAKYGKDKERFMLSAAYALHAERDEAFGISVAEYLKAGVIPIVPDEGGTPEIVDSPALTYRTNEEAAQILARLLSDEAFRSEQRTRCLERAKAFTREAYMERQRKLLDDIVHSVEKEK